MSDDSEIGRADFVKYAGSLVLIIVAIVGVTFGLMNYFLSIREHTAFKERIDSEISRLIETQETKRISKEEFDREEHAHEFHHQFLQKQIDDLVQGAKIIAIEKLNDLQHRIDVLQKQVEQLQTELKRQR